MADWTIVTLDVISFIAFSVALVLVLRERFEASSPYSRVIKFFFALAVLVYVFVGLSNILEHSGITAVLDEYEDYVEILFVPLIAYAVYTMHTARLYNEARRSGELLAAEHGLLTAIVDTSPTGIMLVTSAGAVAFANDRAREALRLQGDGESLQMPDDLTCISTQDSSVKPLSLEKLAQGVTLFGSTCIVETGGRKVALSVSSSPLGVDAIPGTPQGSVVAFVDVTEREEARQALLDAQARYSLDLERTVDERTVELLSLNRELETVNRAKREFVANVSHELKTPLSAVKGFTDLLLSGMPGPVNAEQTKQLQLMAESSQELLALVERLLELERVESGHAVITPAHVEIGQVAGRVVDLIGPLANERGVTLTIDAADGVAAETDAGLLGQIVRNLVSNAVKFTPRNGSVTVTVLEMGECCRISVADTGMGIAPADQERIFEPFVQLAASGEDKLDGTGLGLSICKELASALGGTLLLKSAPGEGSTFTLEIPARFSVG